MLKKKVFSNIVCDCCNTELDESWHDDHDVLKLLIAKNNWKELGGDHYCPECWRIDDEDNIVTKDNRKFTD